MNHVQVAFQNWGVKLGFFVSSLGSYVFLPSHALIDYFRDDLCLYLAAQGNLHSMYASLLDFIELRVTYMIVWGVLAGHPKISFSTRHFFLWFRNPAIKNTIKPGKKWDKLSTSTGFFRISEPSTVSLPSLTKAFWFEFENLTLISGWHTAPPYKTSSRPIGIQRDGEMDGISKLVLLMISEIREKTSW